MMENQDEPHLDRYYESDFFDLMRARIEKLRIRLLDSSRRNPLINIPFRSNSSSILRFVDEIPDYLVSILGDGKAMRLAPLPPIDEELPDEGTARFLSALDIARHTNDVYLKGHSALDPVDENFAQKELDLERALKDHVREVLHLKPRQTKDRGGPGIWTSLPLS